MGRFKEYLSTVGVDVEALQKKTWSAKQGKKLMKDLQKKYTQPPDSTQSEGKK